MPGRNKVFAIADLHLDGGQNKPMDIFGSCWADHSSKMMDAWRDVVAADDTVLIPGDISWAVRLSDALSDLERIAALPGKKILIRGNHDYWWTSVSRLRASLPAGMYVLQNDAMVIEQFAVAGTRGWLVPSRDMALKPDDRKIYLRELVRMRLSLEDAQQKRGNRPILVMMHYPPFYDLYESNGFTEMFKSYDVQKVVFGHIHGQTSEFKYDSVQEGITYKLVSADSLCFIPCNL